MTKEAHGGYKTVLLLDKHNELLDQLKRITAKSRNALLREAIEDLLYKYRIAEGNLKLEEARMEDEDETI